MVVNLVQRFYPKGSIRLADLVGGMYYKAQA